MAESNNELNEMAILGNILYDDTGDIMLTVVPQLTVDDFVSPKNKLIYQAILSMNKNRVHPDKATLITELKNEKTFEEAGGEEYINKILENAISLSSTQTYINALQDASLMRNFLKTLDDIHNNATTQAIGNVNDFIGEAEKQIVSITHKRRTEGVKSMKDVSDALVVKLVKQTKEFEEKGISPNGITGQPTGYDNMNYYTKGWHRGDMIIVGARPSVGKTAFALNLLYKVAKQGTPVVFFSLEMSAESIGMRLLEMVSSLTQDEINSMKFLETSKADQILVSPKDDAESARVMQLQRGFDELRELPFYIDDNPGSKILDITTKCQKICNSISNIGLIAIDYIGLITGGGRGGSDNRQQEVADISRQLKQMARQLQVPVLALTQLSRDSEKRPDHTPQMSDIRDSGSIEQDADMIFMLYRKDYYSTSGGNEGADNKDSNGEEQKDNDPISPVDVRLIKNRNGQVGTLRFMFDKEHCSFNEITDDYGEPPSHGF